MRFGDALAWGRRFWPGLLVLAASPVIAADDPPGKLAEALQPFVEGRTLAGAVLLVANEEKVLARETVGYADLGAKTPMRADNLFWIASMTKPITGTALMILVDEGKVNINDPIEKHLPEFKDLWVAVERDEAHVLLKRPSKPVTIAHVLSHTSGMPFRSALEQPTIDRLPLADAVRTYAITPLLSEPGTKFLYSNAGINTAGRIIEVVSGMPYEEFLAKRLFEPLGMKDTTFQPNAAQLARLAKTYRPNQEKTDLEEMAVGPLKQPLSDPHRYPCPGGGLFSTADDLARFCRMVLAGGAFEGKRILSKESVRVMSAIHTGDLPNAYGLGWSTSRTSGGSFGHGGAYATNMTVDPQQGLVYVYLVQHNGYGGADGAKILPTFHKTAAELFARK